MRTPEKLCLSDCLISTALEGMCVGIDCLVGHAHDYKAHPTEGTLAAIAGTATPDAASPTILGAARDSRDNSDFDHDGQPDLVLDTNGDGVMDAPLMADLDGDGDRPL